jgi:hypothetical protein
MLVAHDLLLLLLDDTSGKMPAFLTEPDKALAGAVLVELAAGGFVDAEHPPGKPKQARIVASSVQPPGQQPPGQQPPGQVPQHLVLRGALDVVRAGHGRRADQLLGPIAKGLRVVLANELVQAGALRREQHKVLGLFPVTRLLAQNRAYEDELRRQLVAVLDGTRMPDNRTGPLIALLSALDAVANVLPVADKRQAKRRAKEIAAGDWAAVAVRKAVEAVQAAAVAAVMGAAAAASAGGGS